MGESFQVKFIRISALFFYVFVLPVNAQTSVGPASAAESDESAIKIEEVAGAQAEDPRNSERAFAIGENAGVSGGVGFFSVLRVFLVLILAALAVYGVMFVLKKGLRRENGSSPHIKLLASLPLTPKTSAAVISVGERAWVTGVSDAGINLIAEINDRETIDTMKLEYEKRAASEVSGPIKFLDFARRFIPRSQTRISGDGAIRDENSFRKNIEKLRNL